MLYAFRTQGVEHVKRLILVEKGSLFALVFRQSDAPAWIVKNHLPLDRGGQNGGEQPVMVQNGSHG